MATPNTLNLIQDFNGLELKSTRLENLSSAPTAIGATGRSPLKGDFYFDSTLNQLGYFNGTSWIYGSSGIIESIGEGTAISVDNTDPANPIVSVVIADLIDDSVSTTTNIYSAAKVDSQIAAAVTGAVRLVGDIDCSTNPNYPAATVGDLYIVSVAGKIGGSAGIAVEVNDSIYCKTTNGGGNQATVGADFFITQANVDGAVTGPASAVSGNIPTFNGTSGKVIQDGGVAVSTDGTFASNSDSLLPTQKASKTYADTKVAANSAITGATKTKITYDAKGLVTSGADATTADINDSTNRRYVTDSELTVIGNTSGVNTGDQTISLSGDVSAAGGTGALTTTIGANKVLYSMVKRYAASFTTANFTSGTITIAAATHGLGVGLYNVIIVDSSGVAMAEGQQYELSTNLSTGAISISVVVGFEFDGSVVITRIN